jgi:hypothetical protein
MKTLRPDVVRELGDATGDRAAIAGLGDAVVERGEDARVVRYERAEAHREHDGDNQRQDAAHDPGDGLAVARGASRPSAADGNGAEDRREQASRQGEREQDTAATRLATPRTRAATLRPFADWADDAAPNEGADPGS